jgi:iron-sulfur cluster assembly protein
MITLTPSAAQHMAQQIEAQSGVGILFGAQSGGCTGFSYSLEVALAPPVTRDWMGYESHGVRIWVNGADLHLVDGTTIDWQRQGLNQRMVFINDRETARCGCGESFTV